MYGHLLPTIEVSRPASRASVKQDLSQFQQESQSPEVVNESTNFDFFVEIVIGPALHLQGKLVLKLQ